MYDMLLNNKINISSLYNNIKSNVDIIRKKKLDIPCLAVIIIGNNFASDLYVKNKIFSCKKVGFLSKVFKLSSSVRENILIELIHVINKDLNIHGILLHLPLPSKFNSINIFKHIEPSKDVELLNPINFGKYIMGFNKIIIPCTPAAILYLLNIIGVKFKGLKTVILNTSNIIGKPLIFELLSKKSTVIIVNEFSKNITNITKFADVLIVAIGSPKFITRKYVHKNSIVIDVGINCINNNDFVGDVNYSDINNFVKYVTPVPGGIGPLTVIHLLKNTLVLYLLNIGFYYK